MEIPRTSRRTFLRNASILGIGLSTVGCVSSNDALQADFQIFQRYSGLMTSSEPAIVRFGLTTPVAQLKDRFYASRDIHISSDSRERYFRLVLPDGPSQADDLRNFDPALTMEVIEPATEHFPFNLSGWVKKDGSIWSPNQDKVLYPTLRDTQPWPDDEVQQALQHLLRFPVGMQTTSIRKTASILEGFKYTTPIIDGYYATITSWGAFQLQSTGN